MLAFQHPAMATVFEIRCTHADAEYARQAAKASFAEVDRLELALSRFVENSDIARLNALSAGENAVVGYEALTCLLLASRLWAETGGAFDPAVGSGFGSLEIVAGEFVVRSPRGGVNVDLGAIGKGYAVDRIADVLEDWEISRALIDAGTSSVLALDPPADQEDWPLSLSEPGPAGVALACLGARQRALGASGIQKTDHIRNPFDGSPVRTRRAAWVSAPRAVLIGISDLAGVEPSPTAVADALSTAFMIQAVDEIEAYCQSHPGLEVWILEQEFVHFPATDGPIPG
jgi:thiamine biosynthesis lipoprotein